MQLRDNGTMEDVVFSNNVVSTRQYNGDGFAESEWGEAEPIYVTALPRTNQTKVIHSCTNWHAFAFVQLLCMQSLCCLERRAPIKQCCRCFD